MSTYAYSQKNYSAGAQTVNIDSSGYYLAELFNVNSEASNKTLPANITSTGTVILSTEKTSAYSESDLSKRNMHYSAKVIYFAENGTISFDCTGTTGSYTTQLFIVIPLNAEPENLVIGYYRSSIDNQGIQTTDTLSLNNQDNGNTLVQFLEFRNDSGANSSLTITTPNQSTPITFSISGTTHCSISAAFCDVENTLTATSTNSGGYSYATKMYMVLYMPNIAGYTVHYNSNGGHGTMQDQTIAYDTPTPLSANSFTKEGYNFIGWALSPTGGATYTDEETVTNIAGEEREITLYAVWASSGYLDIYFQVNHSESNVLDKDITNLFSVRGTFRASTSIIEPVFIIEGDLAEISQANYVTIPLFHRSYYISNITSVKTNLVQINCVCDVLSSFKEGIRANTGIIRRSADSNLYNLLLNDGSLKTYQDPYILTKPFPYGFGGYSFILAIAGG